MPSTGTRAAGRASAAPVLTACALVLVTAAFLARLPLDAFVTLFPDDAFFYMKTAWHAAQGHGTTFDGINLTSGYHPLYLGLLTALSSVVPLVDLAGMRAVFWLDTVLTLGWLAVMGEVARTLGWNATRSWAWLLALLPLAAVGDYGMEPNVALPLAWSYVVLAWRHDGDAARAAAAGAVGALACLARLDSVILVGAVALTSLHARGDLRWPLPAATVRSALLLVGPTLVALAGYSAVNLAVFGESTSVSSWLKMGPTAENDALGSGFEGLVTNAAVVACVVLGLLAVVRAMRAPSPDAWRVAGLGAWIVTYLAVIGLMLRGGVEIWYFPLPLSAALLIALDLGPRWVAGWGPRAVTAALALVMAAGLMSAGVLMRWQLSRGWLFADALAIGQWVDQHLPRDAVLYQVDNSGIVGYFSRRPLINGDGLINGWDYQRDLRSGRLAEYLRRTGVGYLVHDEYEGGDDLRVQVPLWDQPALTLAFAQPPARVAQRGRFVVVAVDHAQVRVQPPASARGSAP